MSDNQNKTGGSGTCEGFQDLLPLYEGGELELDQADRLREHLSSCTACSAQWVVGKKAIAMRQEAWALQAGETPDLWPGIQAQLRAEGCLKSEEQPVSSQASGGVLLRFPMLRYAAAAALLVGAFALGSQFMGSGPDNTPAPDGGNRVALGSGEETQGPGTLPAPTVEKTVEKEAPKVGRLRLAGPDEASVLEQARPLGLEETPSGDLRRRTESMQVAGWR